MGEYIGLDVSLKQTSMCIVDEAGSLMFEGKTASDPECLAKLIRSKAPNLVRVGLESGQTSVWLTHALRAEGLPVVCWMPARHMQPCRCGQTCSAAATRAAWPR